MTTVRSAVALLVLSAILVACAGDDDDSVPPGTTARVNTTSTTTAAATDAEVLAAYRGFWDAYLAAGDPMDPAHPDLELFATAASLERVRESFTQHFANGEVIRGDVELSPVIEEVDGDRATLRDCYLDRTHLFDATTGDQIDPPGEMTFEVVVTLVFEDSDWKVSTLDHVGEACER